MYGQDRLSREVFRAEILRLMNPLELEYGFPVAAHLCESEPLHETIVYAGKNVAFVFIADLREDSLENLVCKVKHGKLVMDGSSGGYSEPLSMALVRHFCLRSESIPKIRKYEDEIDRISHFSERWWWMINNFGSELLEEGLLPPGGWSTVMNSESLTHG
jgi:hypothetical protein